MIKKTTKTSTRAKKAPKAALNADATVEVVAAPNDTAAENAPATDAGSVQNDAQPQNKETAPSAPKRKTASKTERKPRAPRKKNAATDAANPETVEVKTDEVINETVTENAPEAIAEAPEKSVADAPVVAEPNTEGDAKAPETDAKEGDAEAKESVKQESKDAENAEAKPEHPTPEAKDAEAKEPSAKASQPADDPKGSHKAESSQPKNDRKQSKPLKFVKPTAVIHDIIELAQAPSRQIILNDQQVQQLTLEDAEERHLYLEQTLARVLDYDIVLSDTNIWLELLVGHTSSHSDPRVNARLQFERQLEFISRMTRRRKGKFMMMAETYEEIDRFATQQEPTNYQDADFQDQTLCLNVAARLAKRLILSQQRENRLRIEGIGAESHHAAFADPAIIRRTVEFFAQGKKVLLITNDASVGIRSMGLCDDLQRFNGIDDETWEREYAPLRPMVFTFDDLKLLDQYTRQYHFIQQASGKQWMEDIPTNREAKAVEPLRLWMEAFRPGDRHRTPQPQMPTPKQEQKQNDGNNGQNGKQNGQNGGQKQKQNNQKQANNQRQKQEQKPQQEPKQQPQQEPKQPQQEPKQQNEKPVAQEKQAPQTQPVAPVADEKTPMASDVTAEVAAPTADNQQQNAAPEAQPTAPADKPKPKRRGGRRSKKPQPSAPSAE